MSKNAIVYGNGESRKEWDITRKFNDTETWGCNRIYEEGVQLVQLNKGEADIFRFNNVTEELKKYNYYATLNINKSLPEISISSSSKILFTIRAKKETDSKTNKITYRNYIEKGPFLGQLIATSASQE